MQTKKAKYHLKRIETILNLHDDSMSRLDQDILLEDIRHLYDIVLNADHEQPDDASHTPRDHTYVKPAEIPAQKVDPKNQNGSHNQGNSSPSDTTDKPDSSITEELKEPAPNNTHQTESHHTPTTITYEKTSPEVDSYSNNKPTMETASHEQINGRSENAEPDQAQSQEYDDIIVKESAGHPELFDFHATSDLSDRLSNSKIDQLNKILTINDKILYINHLFGGEAIPFQESLKKFEDFYTYEEAKKYASEELVENYNWTKKEKFETVRQFMKQVKRLYG